MNSTSTPLPAFQADEAFASQLDAEDPLRSYRREFCIPTAADGSPVPFTLREKTLDFFAGSPGSVRVVAGDHEYMYSLTLPQLWDSKWDPPADIHRGIPRFTQVLERVTELWPWLALLGLTGLVVEWLMYGRFRSARFAPRTISRPIAQAAEVRR